MLRCSINRILLPVFLAIAIVAAFIFPDHAFAARSIQSDPRYASIVIDVNSGKVMYSRQAESARYPASLTKIMTLYLLFEAIRDGKVTTNTRMPVSKHAAAQAPSKLGLAPGKTITVDAAIRALVTKSANDIAVVVAEHLAGTEDKFARIMTLRARALGMSKTTFKNASGLPNRAQTTTAHDMARLGQAIIRDFPRQYAYFSTRSFTYSGRSYGNHNRLLGNVRGVDGIKTGYTRASGFNLTTSVRRDDRHVIAVVMGGPTGRARDNHMRYLLNRFVPK
ncbi:MAG: D-alanyl-D-alanine carboxypeptidase, partial [Fimbriimonadaceae bacterium]|nr:D-alanyl-D-alanine carboxypeptidase [Alphaproteobacteria bacterium]